MKRGRALALRGEPLAPAHFPAFPMASLDDWLPKDHLARFVADIVDQLDLSALNRSIPRRGLGGLSTGNALGFAWPSGWN
jgi:hypothetical protein